MTTQASSNTEPITALEVTPSEASPPSVRTVAGLPAVPLDLFDALDVIEEPTASEARVLSDGVDSAAQRGLALYRLHRLYTACRTPNGKGFSRPDVAFAAVKETAKLLNLYGLPAPDGADPGMIPVATVKEKWLTVVGVIREALRDAILEVSPRLRRMKDLRTIRRVLKEAILAALDEAVGVGEDNEDREKDSP